MSDHYLRTTLTLLIICILSHKINAHESIDINTEACQMNLLSHKEELSVFFEAIEQDDIDKLLIFKTMDWDLHTSYQNGRILLHYASALGRTEVIHTLVAELGVDVKIKDPETGQTALHYAVSNTDPSSRLDTIHTLITLGANANALDNKGYAPAQYIGDEEKPANFKYSKEQRERAAELIVPPYNIQILKLAKLIQAPRNTLSRWGPQYRVEHNIPTNKQRYQKLRKKTIQMFNRGVRERQIAKKLGILEITVSDWIRQYKQEHKIPLKTQLYQKLRQQAIEMFKAGIIQKEIAIKLGVSESTVSSWKSRYNAENNIPKKYIAPLQKKKLMIIHMANTLGFTQTESSK